MIVARLFFLIAAVIALCGCSREKATDISIDGLVNDIPGQIGIAVITSDGDTLTVNNSDDYPLMSVFKLHEALAIAHALGIDNQTFDSILNIRREELSTDTWSPMLKDYPSGDIDISVADLVKYSLLESDNNASNLLFEHVASTEQTDSFIHALPGMPQNFKIRYTERQMQADHAKAYENRTSPLACAVLIDKVISDSLVGREMQDSIISWLGDCKSAPNRMSAAVAQFPDARLYHRTGSGYVNERGEIVAINDVGVIVMPDGRKIAIAVLIKDFTGEQCQADSTIAAVTTKILDRFANKDGN